MYNQLIIFSYVETFCTRSKWASHLFIHLFINENSDYFFRELDGLVHCVRHIFCQNTFLFGVFLWWTYKFIINIVKIVVRKCNLIYVQWTFIRNEKVALMVWILWWKQTNKKTKKRTKQMVFCTLIIRIMMEKKIFNVTLLKTKKGIKPILQWLFLGLIQH